MAFIRMRSPSRAPPPRRRVGSMASTAMRSLSSWSSRKRRTSSSVSDDLPEPPVPVMPSTGTVRPAAAVRSCSSSVGSSRPSSSAVMARASAPWSPARTSSTEVSGTAIGSTSHACDDRVDHRGEAQLLAVLGREDPGDAVRLELGDLARDDHAAAAAEDAHVPEPAGAQLVDQVAEVLVVAALVRRHRHALGVLLHDRREDLVHRAVVAEVDDLAALRLEDPPHDVDGGVVAVEEARRRDDAHGVDRYVQRILGHASRIRRNRQRSRVRPSVGSGPCRSCRTRRTGPGCSSGCAPSAASTPPPSTGTTWPVASRTTSRAWEAILAGPTSASGPTTPRGRPSSTGAMCETSTASTRGRVGRMLAEDDPHYENWDQDATAIEDRYDEQDPATVAGELAAARRRSSARSSPAVRRRRVGSHRAAQRRRLVHRRLDQPLLPPRHRAPHLGRHRFAPRHADG